MVEPPPPTPSREWRGRGRTNCQPSHSSHNSPLLPLYRQCAASDFLTAIGHQNGTLVMGSGGYRFSDFWRLGLPLSIVVAGFGTSLIVLTWPLR